MKRTRFLTVTQLKAALQALHEATKTFQCNKPRRDAKGRATWGPRDVPYGPHGAAYAEIDPTTLKVRCGACAGTQKVTVAPKASVEIRGRTHFVSDGPEASR